METKRSQDCFCEGTPHCLHKGQAKTRQKYRSFMQMRERVLLPCGRKREALGLRSVQHHGRPQPSKPVPPRTDCRRRTWRDSAGLSILRLLFPNIGYVSDKGTLKVLLTLKFIAVRFYHHCRCLGFVLYKRKIALDTLGAH